MTSRSIGIRLAMVVVPLLAAPPSARAEWIGGGEWWLRENGVELIRSLGVGRPSEQPPADFAFTFDFKLCAMNTLDTYRNIYSRELGLGESPVSIPLTLSAEQMAAVYDAIGSIGFFDYPSAFRGVSQTATGETTTVAPSASYRLEVRSSGVVHSVTWDDRFLPHSEEASRLLKVFDLINGFVNDRPDVKRLPVSRAGCM